MTGRTSEASDGTDRKLDQRRDFRSYVTGYCLALALTLVPFALVYLDVLARTQAFVVIGCLALVQMVVHFRFFLHISLRHNREDLHLILFSTLILATMVAGTLWIMVNLALRMSPLPDVGM